MNLAVSSFSVTDAGTASMLPPPRRNIDTDTTRRKKKAPTLRESDWEPYKDSIIQLHLDEKRTLSEVKTLIEQKYGFAAGIRQYRSRLSQWKLDKNIKPEEMKAIVRRRQQRSLVETDKPGLRFRVRGKEVEPKKIERWMKSHDVTKSMVYAPSPASPTPSAISCATMSEIGSPAPRLALYPGLLGNIDEHFASFSATYHEYTGTSSTTLQPTGIDSPLEFVSVKITEEHTYARWQFHRDIHFPEVETRSCYMHQMSDGKPTETLLGLYERAALRKGRHLMSALLSTDPRVKNMPPSHMPFGYHEYTVGNLGRLIGFFYMHHAIPTDLLAPEIISTRLFATLGTKLESSPTWSIGWDMVDGVSSRQFRVALIDSLVRPTHLHEETAISRDLALVEEHELIPFTWPSNDDDVERAQFFRSHFGHGAAASSLV